MQLFSWSLRSLLPLLRCSWWEMMSNWPRSWNTRDNHQNLWEFRQVTVHESGQMPTDFTLWPGASLCSWQYRQCPLGKFGVVSRVMKNKPLHSPSEASAAAAADYQSSVAPTAQSDPEARPPYTAAPPAGDSRSSASPSAPENHIHKWNRGKTQKHTLLEATEVLRKNNKPTFKVQSTWVEDTPCHHMLNSNITSWADV